MKRTVCIILMFMMMVSFAACGQNANSTSSESSASSNAIQTTAASMTSPSHAENDIAYYFKKYDPQASFTIAKNVPSGDTSLPAGDTVENNDWTRYYAERTGIMPKVVWSASGDAYTQKVNIAIASGDIPDYMEVNIQQFRALVKADMLTDLTDLYSNLAHPIWKKVFAESDDRALKAVTVKGKLMGIPCQSPGGDSAALLWLRKDWLDKLGLPEPKTCDDIEKIALAFVNNDPDGNSINDTSGILVAPSYKASDSGVGNLGEFFTNFGAYPGMWITGSDGKIQNGSLMPGAIPALEKLNSWYKKGVINKEFTTLGENASQQVASNKCGIFFGPWWVSWSPLTDSVVNDPKANWVSYGLPLDANGNYNVGMTDLAQTVGVISKKMKNPEMVIDMYNYMYGGEVYKPKSDKEKALYDKAVSSGLHQNYQPIRVIITNSLAVEKNYEDMQRVLNGTATEDDIRKEYEKDGLDFAYCLSTLQAAERVAHRKNPTEVIADWSLSFGYSTGIKPMTFPNVKRVYSDFIGSTASMEKKGAFLSKLETDSYTKMIVGDTDGKSVADYFNSFVKEYLSKGGQDVQNEVQAEIDASK